jgi:uncharacterized membrane protein (DUF373 family)
MTIIGAMKKIQKYIESAVISVLLVLMAIVIVLATIDLARIILMDILHPQSGLIGVDQLMDIFGSTLIILIGIELVESIKLYLTEHVVHVEVVLEIAIIAIARKIIILDAKNVAPMTLFGIAALLIALAVGYYLEKRGRQMSPKKSESEPSKSA